ncbi:class I SAM-dependent methyltransferase [Rhizobacter sp. Root404]|uniref:class I SAM-dependent methyltransferase n=1 Tax=Rhizobacter sp. Root404 TaxID=1736528 RepID=UPI0009E6A70E|nr:class I SAM-dependent methyltransferase [Rhizobacter sp. Root404]
MDPIRASDGSAGDVDYQPIGTVYNDYRLADSRIAAAVHKALGGAQTVLNIGAGTGSYEPLDRIVTAVEPSATMRARRPAHLVPAIDAAAENLPFDDGVFDAAMGTFTVHQWGDVHRGLEEVRRVTRGPVALLTCDPTLLRDWWLWEYAPEVINVEISRFPAIDTLVAGLGGDATVQRVPIPLNCTDGFNDAYYGRPEMLLDVRARLACSSWSLVDPTVAAQATKRLRDALSDGSWDAKHGHLRRQPTLLGALVLVVGRP